MVTDDTFAGESARATRVAGSCDHSMMSIFSPRSSRLITWIRVPRSPTHAPMGSTSRFVEATATFARSPASRAVAFTTTMPSVRLERGMLVMPVGNMVLLARELLQAAKRSGSRIED